MVPPMAIVAADLYEEGRSAQVGAVVGRLKTDFEIIQSVDVVYVAKSVADFRCGRGNKSARPTADVGLMEIPESMY